MVHEIVESLGESLVGSYALDLAKQGVAVHSIRCELEGCAKHDVNTEKLRFDHVRAVLQIEENCASTCSSRDLVLRTHNCLFCKMSMSARRILGNDSSLIVELAQLHQQ